jgi:hypothetical protein
LAAAEKWAGYFIALGRVLIVVAGVALLVALLWN